MARVTVEDCVKVIPNRFELCLIANNRAKNILSGVSTSLGDSEKPSVIALREVAEGLIDSDKIRSNIIESLKTKSNSDSDEISKGTSDAITEESENTMQLSNNMFLDDNIAVED